VGGAQPVFFDDECLRVIALRNVCWKSFGVATFVLVSYEFGGAEAIVAPISGNH
jgi:hypothetical protein